MKRTEETEFHIYLPYIPIIYHTLPNRLQHLDSASSISPSITKRALNVSRLYPRSFYSHSHTWRHPSSSTLIHPHSLFLHICLSVLSLPPPLFPSHFPSHFPLSPSPLLLHHTHLTTHTLSILVSYTHLTLPTKRIPTSHYQPMASTRRMKMSEKNCRF